MQPFLLDLYPRIDELSQTEVPYFPGQTLAPVSPETEAAWDFTTGRALGGSPVVNQAQSEALKTLSGDYLTAGNPYMNNITDRIARETMGAMNARYGAAGQRAGGPAEREMFARTMSESLAPYAFQDYARERDAMGRMSMLAPQLGREDYFDLGQLERIGGERQARSQAEIADEMQRHYYPYREPYDRLSFASGIFHGGGQLGGTSTSQQTYQPPGVSPLAYAGAGLQTIGNFLPFAFML